MNTCDTCKHWGDQTDEPGYRRCDAEATAYPPPIDRAKVADGAFDYGLLATGPKFGCIHHAPK